MAASPDGTSMQQDARRRKAEALLGDSAGGSNTPHGLQSSRRVMNLMAYRCIRWAPLRSTIEEVLGLAALRLLAVLDNDGLVITTS
jgi:hypothetical protein